MLFRSKLDRRALPAPERGAYGSRVYEAPQGEPEETLAKVWQELLHVGTAGRQDNFFELGGHSLTAMRLMQLVTERFAIQFNVQAVFRYANFTEMAQFIRDVSSDNQHALASSSEEFDQGII